MTRGILTAAAVTVLLAWPRPAVTAAPADAGGRTPVVVELFTSEGCSDCPTQPVPGAEVLVLAEHVDYFNSARWADRFSSAAFTARQNGYVSRFHLAEPYTPEMVVDGHTEFVGSDAGRAEWAIAEAARAPQAEVGLSTAGNKLRVHIGPLPTTDGGPADVLLAVTEDGLRVRVRGGENAGRTLEHNGVVRGLRVIGSVAASPTAAFDTSVPLPAVGDGLEGASRVVVFVQERGSRRILGAAALVL